MSGALLAGVLLCLLAAAWWLFARHLAEARFYDRPRFARVRGFDAALALLRWVAFGAALVLLWRAAPWTAVAAALVFLAGWIWRRLVRGPAWKRRLMKRDYERLRHDRPDLAERDLLVQVVLLHHPGWGEELVAQMVLDYRTLDSLARVVARMERGFRGFAARR